MCACASFSAMLESPTVRRGTVSPHNRPHEAVESVLMPSSTTKFPVAEKLEDADEGGRGGRPRYSRMNPDLFQEGATTLLFLDNVPAVKKNAPLASTNDTMGEMRRRLFSKNVLEDGLKDGTKHFASRPTLRPQDRVLPPSQMPSLGMSTGERPPGIDKYASMNEFCSSPSESLRGGWANRIQRATGNEADYSPKLYSALLPATVKLKQVGEMHGGIVMGAAASELFAERDARQLSRGMCPPEDNKTQFVPDLELRQFEKKMKELQEHGKQQQRRWKRCMHSAGTAAGGVVTMVSDMDDSSCGSDKGHDGGGDSRASRLGRQQQKNNASRLAVANLNEQIRGLEIRGDNRRDVAFLRSELKKSHDEVEKARHGVAVLSLTSQGDKERLQIEQSNQRRSWDKRLHGILEDVSWVSENNPQRASRETHSASQLFDNLQPRKSRQCNSIVVTDQNVGAALENLLYYGKGTTVYGLDPRQKEKSNRSYTQQKQRVDASLPGLPLSPLGQASSLGSCPPVAGLSKPDVGRTLKPYPKGVVNKRRKPFAVEYGVGEHCRMHLESLFAQWRLKDIQSELQRGENIQRTRELLLELRPMRVDLLDKSLQNFRESPRVILQKHRRQIFEKVVEMDAEERGRACCAFVDLLETSYHGEVSENSWDAVSKALQKTRDLISISPTRCNARTFQNILRDYFSMSHLVEGPVRELLLQLSKLFDMTKSQYDTAISHAYQRLNRPKDYQARFREIDRMLVGMPLAAETRVRVTLDRCRFAYCVASTNLYAGCDTLGCERIPDRPEVLVQLKSDNETVVSSVVLAEVCDPSKIKIFYANRKTGKMRSSYSADLLNQIFRLRFSESSDLSVTLLLNGKATAACVFCLAQCVFNARSTAVLWLHLTGENDAEAEIKLTLELLGERERQALKMRQKGEVAVNTTNVDKKNRKEKETVK